MLIIFMSNIPAEDGIKGWIILKKVDVSLEK